MGKGLGAATELLPGAGNAERSRGSIGKWPGGTSSRLPEAAVSKDVPEAEIGFGVVMGKELETAKLLPGSGNAERILGYIGKLLGRNGNCFPEAESDNVPERELGFGVVMEKELETARELLPGAGSGQQ